MLVSIQGWITRIRTFEIQMALPGFCGCGIRRDTGTPPDGYGIGSEYTSEQINAALDGDSSIVPSRDGSGHGTAVLGIAAGNGSASDGVYRGVASESTLVVVKLGTASAADFPRTTQLMQGIDYVIRLSLELQMPIAVNLSFGNNYGSHSRGFPSGELYRLRLHIGTKCVLYRERQ